MIQDLDLTKGSIPGLLLRLSAPIIFSMFIFTLYLVVDLFFVGRLGPDAVAAVSISGNALFIVLGLSFILGNGATTLIAQSLGAGDATFANSVFRQTLLMTFLVALVACLAGLISAVPYIRFFGGTGKSLQWGVAYFRIFSISFFFIQLLHVMEACYRGVGNTKTPMKISMLSVGLNIVLDPILIFGLLGVPKLGVRGAAIASLISQILALGIYIVLICNRRKTLTVKGSWRPDPSIIVKSLFIGVPSGITYFLLAINLLITYRVISSFGTAALASVGIGFRVLQTIYLPVIAVTAAMAPIVGQNYGAHKPHRIFKTLQAGGLIGTVIMLTGTGLCGLFPEGLIGFFSEDAQVIHYGVIYLTIMSLGNVFVGTIMAVAAVFQGLGKTYPGLVAAVCDNLLFALLVFTLPGYFGWGIGAVWWIKLSTAIVETAIGWIWLRFDLKRIRSMQNG
jgi:putative MATE family efflux protein